MRLKGGDPFVFGRGGEEAQGCAAGIPFEVVPGVTAGVAAPAYAGIPVTYRGRAGGVAFVTGHEDPSKPETALDWAALARFPGTLVFYMGVRALPRIAEPLIEHGRPADEPVRDRPGRHAPGQRTVVRDAGRLADAAAAASAPAVTVVGPVVALRDELTWFERRPLHGRSVVVTRARAQASALAERLRDSARPSSRRRRSASSRCRPRCPRSVRLRPARGHQRERGAGLDGSQDGHDARALPARRSPRSAPGPPARCATVGSSPTSSPRGRSPRARRGARARPVHRALIARAEEARDVLPDALRERGAEVDVLALYHTVAEPLDDAARPRSPPTTSRSRQRRPCRFLAAAGGRAARARLVSIGPATSERAARRRASSPTAGARHTPDGLVDARRGGRGAAAPDAAPITFLSDYGHDGRLRRRLPRRDRADRARRAGHRPHARHRAPRRRAGALVLRRALPFAPAGVHLAVVDPEVGGRRRAIALRTADEDRLLVGPDNGLLPLGGRALRRRRRGGRDRALAAPARARLGDVPRPRPVRARRRAPRGGRAARRRPATRSIPTSSSARAAARARRRTTSSSRTRSPSTASATSRSTSSTTSSASSRAWRLGRAGRAVDGAATPSTRTTFADVAPGRAARSTRTPTGRSRSPSTAGRRPQRARRRRARRRAAAAPA